MKKITSLIPILFLTFLSLSQSGRGLGHEDDISWSDTVKVILFCAAIYYLIIMPYNSFHNKKEEKKEAEEKIKQEAKEKKQEIQSNNYKLYLNQKEQELIEKTKNTKFDIFNFKNHEVLFESRNNSFFDLKKDCSDFLCGVVKKYKKNEVGYDWNYKEEVYKESTFCLYFKNSTGYDFDYEFSKENPDVEVILIDFNNGIEDRHGHKRYFSFNGTEIKKTNYGNYGIGINWDNFSIKVITFNKNIDYPHGKSSIQLIVDEIKLQIQSALEEVSE